MKKLLIFALLGLITSSAFPQHVIDSLTNKLKYLSTDTSRIRIMINLAYEYINYDSKKALEYLGKTKELSEKTNYKKGLASYYYVNGLLKKNDIPEALESFKKSYQLFSELNNKLWMAIITSEIGNVYNSCSQYDKAMESYLNALKIYKSINNNSYIGICYSNIASIYGAQKNYKLALEYHKMSLSKLRNQGDFIDFLNIAIDYSQMKQYSTSLLYYDSIIKQLYLKKDFKALSYVYFNLGNTYANLKNYKKSKQYNSLSYQLAAKAGNNSDLMYASINLAEVYIKLNQPDSVIILLEKNLGILGIMKSYSFFRSYYKNLSEAYEIKGETGTALKYYKMFKAAEDSLSQEQSKQRLYELQISFEVDKKNKEIESLNQQNLLKSNQLSNQKIIILLILISAILSLAFALVSYNKFRLKQKLAAILEAKNAEIKQQHHKILAMNDILEKQNESLLEMDNIKSRFFTNISHEFRTPLTLIISPLTSIYEETTDPDAKSVFSHILDQARRLLVLINQLLDLSKLQSAKSTLRLSYDDINKFLKTLCESFSSYAIELGINLQYHSVHAPLLVWFDKENLQKILTNLISNALKHTSCNGFVHISLTNNQENKNFIEITVCDNGMGIESHEIKNIFEPFYQSTATVCRKIKGSGVGLALVKELVELHGGTIAVISETGKGSSFDICIAVNKDMFPSALILENEEDHLINHDMDTLIACGNDRLETVNSRDKTTILVVEDNDDMRDYITKSLLTNYQIIEAVNGREGFDKAVALSPDLIITDVMMPEINGYKMTQLIKNDSRTSHIPVIMLTAKASEENKMEGLESAADDYIVKPFNLKELLLRIKNTIHSRQKLREKFQKYITIIPSEVTATSMDEQFLTKALSIVENHLAESEFSVDDFCEEIGISKTHVYRKLKALTDQSFTEFLRVVRLKRAASLLMTKSGNLTEIAYATGFSNLSYFSKCFKEQYGINPSEYFQLNSKTVSK